MKKVFHYISALLLPVSTAYSFELALAGPSKLYGTLAVVLGCAAILQIDNIYTAGKSDARVFENFINYMGGMHATREEQKVQDD